MFQFNYNIRQLVINFRSYQITPDIIKSLELGLESNPNLQVLKLKIDTHDLEISYYTFRVYYQKLLERILKL